MTTSANSRAIASELKNTTEQEFEPLPIESGERMLIPVVSPLRMCDRRDETLANHVAAWAQQPGRVYRIGGMSSLPARNPPLVEWLNELGRLGFVEGQNFTIDEVSSGLRPEQFPEAAARLVKAGVDVILAGGDPAIRAAQQANGAIRGL